MQFNFHIKIIMRALCELEKHKEAHPVEVDNFGDRLVCFAVAAVQLIALVEHLFRGVFFQAIMKTYRCGEVICLRSRGRRRNWCRCRCRRGQ